MNKEIEKLLQIYQDELAEMTAFTAESKHTDEETLREVRKLKILITALEAQKADRWIPITERFPKCEEEVEITVERRCDNKTYTFTCRAVYEDGNMWSEDSAFCWDNFDNMEYDEEKDDYKVPEGWFESVSYTEESHIIDDFVLAWKPINKPWTKEWA